MADEAGVRADLLVLVALVRAAIEKPDVVYRPRRTVASASKYAEQMAAKRRRVTPPSRPT